ncbi:MAG: amino acid ABC transporter substrate-binding protein [Chloroflexi bacterium]|nr:MAG: amino acid ABC transporter substrate-binding protein [Chloroflexota bacterium]TMD19208.1 MAG: amino acid ABC transporter substrate-binding protein [Chloroflexota bacterium]TMF00207.1 MAG: amino acid ABC transporter substrate-binding protein [Chloroflexota bacterium]
MYRSRLRLALGVVLVLVTTACGSSTNGNTSSSTIQGMIKTITPGVLTIATYGSALPLMKVGPGANEIGGLSGGWANAFAQDFGLQVKLFQTTFSSTLLAVQQGKADLGEPVYYNPTRAKTYYYTYPVDLESLVVFTKKSFSYSGPSSLQGHKVATVTGYVWTPYFQKFFGSNLQLYTTQADAATAFKNGQAEAYLDADLNYFNAPLSLSTDISLHPVASGDFGIPADIIANESYWIVNCNEKALANAMNLERDNLEASGKWKTILAQDGAPAGTPQSSPPLMTPAEGC